MSQHCLCFEACQECKLQCRHVWSVCPFNGQQQQQQQALLPHQPTLQPCLHPGTGSPVHLQRLPVHPLEQASTQTAQTGSAPAAPACWPARKSCCRRARLQGCCVGGGRAMTQGRRRADERGCAAFRRLYNVQPMYSQCTARLQGCTEGCPCPTDDCRTSASAPDTNSSSCVGCQLAVVTSRLCPLKLATSLCMRTSNSCRGGMGGHAI